MQHGTTDEVTSEEEEEEDMGEVQFLFLLVFSHLEMHQLMLLVIVSILVFSTRTNNLKTRWRKKRTVDQGRALQKFIKLVQNIGVFDYTSCLSFIYLLIFLKTLYSPSKAIYYSRGGAYTGRAAGAELIQIIQI